MNLYTNVKPAQASIEAAVGGWSAVGCYSDSGSARTLGAYSFSNSKMTNDMCQQRCAEKGYKYAGTE
jgi:hypothetical protein